MIIRSKRKRRYTNLPTRPLEDRRLSAEARGVLAYLVSRPDDWRVSLRQLEIEFDVGREKMQRIITEHINAGYIARSERQTRATNSGKFASFTYLVAEDPQDLPPRSEKPTAVKLPQSVSPRTANPHLTITDKGTTTDETVSSKLSRSKADSKSFDQFWAEYPRKVGKVAARKAFARIIDAGDATAEELIVGAGRYRAERSGQEPEFTKHPTAWLADGRWTDEPAGDHHPIVPYERQSVWILMESARWRPLTKRYEKEHGKAPPHVAGLGGQGWSFPRAWVDELTQAVAA